jgi:anti-sigma factor RsiW
MNTNQHIPEQELVAYAFGDSSEAQTIAKHLGDCAECAAEFKQLQSVLMAVNDETLPVPEREHYAEQVWASVKPRLHQQQATNWTSWFRPQRIAFAGGMLALLIFAFMIGRVTKSPAPNGNVPNVAANQNGAERLVRAEVGSHLERSQMMLVELSNAEAGKDGLDISEEQQRARDLLEANRLYRQSAKRAGDPAVAAVLDELERVLIEIANSPSDLSQQRLAELQQQIQDQGILFKVRVIGSKVRSSTKEHESEQPAKLRRL